MKINKILLFTIMLQVLILNACKPSYKSPLESPAVTKASEDTPYKFDFEQMEEDVGTDIQSAGIYGFINDFNLTGDNDAQKIIVNFDIEDNVSDSAIEILLTDTMRFIVDEANTQDFRIDGYTNEDFGNLCNIFGVNLIVKSGDKLITEYNIEKGDSVPFDPTLTIENITG
ncbi:hypothetical protein [Oribacterium sp. FC2011]|uniref:hypothetical protein n=1 Tax=Oribacterium sp. FC2011 TaxID=1408311 RepID=UPI0012DE14B2|nr:hypothetical protein [Oribacterium sp. FC2011]